MSIYDVVPMVRTMIFFYGLPDAVVVHCGGNDIGRVNCAKLLFDIKFMLYVVSKMINCKPLIYSSILPRLNWRYSKYTTKMNITRKRINRGVKSYQNKTAGYTIVHTNFEDVHKSLYDRDGVHLSYIGNDIFLNSLQSALEQFHFTPFKFVYPLQY